MNGNGMTAPAGGSIENMIRAESGGVLAPLTPDQIGAVRGFATKALITGAVVGAGIGGTSILVLGGIAWGIKKLMERGEEKSGKKGKKG